MATKIGLTKEQTAERDAMVAKLSATRSALDTAIEAHNALVRGALAALDAVAAEYNEALEEARGFAGDIARTAEEAIGERSDKWQEGEKGEAARTFAEEWEGVSLEDFDIGDAGEIDSPDEDAAETLASLPDAPEE